MNSLSTVNPTQEPTFAKPMLLLGDCHRRIENFLDQLVHVIGITGEAALSVQSRENLDTALRYFNQLPALHNADEEESLFPRLRQIAQGATEAAYTAREALTIMDRLETDHVAAEKHHEIIDALGNRWLEYGLLSRTEIELLREEILELRKFYAAHIALEDKKIFPLASKLLGTKELEAVGREMAKRRGVDFDSPDAIHRCARRKQKRQLL
jgi:hemerythrin-like domain-containing protein